MGDSDSGPASPEEEKVINSSDTRPPRRMSGIAWVAIFIGITTLFVITWSQFKNAGKGKKVELPEMGVVPEFSFTDEKGETITKDSLLGSVWVANFIFTRCPGPCPMLTSRMLEIQENLGKIKDKRVRLVSFTVDPEHDTPEVLSRYAKDVHADPERWSFVTAGTKAATENFVIKGMLQPLQDDPNGVPEHTTRFVIVDSKGKFRAFHDGSHEEVISKVLMDIGALMRETKGDLIRKKLAEQGKEKAVQPTAPVSNN
ncbi:MAG: SCO family protein [Chthoniobacterales bacterium]